MPPNQGGAASQGAPQPQSPQQQFTDFLHQNAYIPVWLHPHLAAGVIRHFGKDGSAIIHPHPTTLMDNTTAASMAGGGVAQSPVTPVAPGGAMQRIQPGPASRPAAAAAAVNASRLAPLSGIPGGLGAPGTAGRSIFGGGPVGAGGAMQQEPVFARKGAALDATGGGKVPGKDLGHDSVSAMLEPGEAVFNKKQLAGIKPKPGKEHLLRGDQKKAMRKASNRAGRK
jgi:hypothetical protein